MPDLIRRITWLTIVVAFIVYCVYLVIGNTINAQTEEPPPTVVRDQLKKGQHFLSGVVTVPTSCDQLSLHVDQTGPIEYLLTFSTWEEPAIPCITEPTARVFRATVFAPSLGVHFKAVLNDLPLPIAVYPMIK